MRGFRSNRSRLLTGERCGLEAADLAALANGRPGEQGIDHVPMFIGGELREVGSPLDPPEFLLRRDLGRTRAVLDERDPDADSARVNPWPAKTPNRILRPFRSVKNFGFGEETPVNHGVKQDPIATPHEQCKIPTRKQNLIPLAA